MSYLLGYFRRRSVLFSAAMAANSNRKADIRERSLIERAVVLLVIGIADGVFDATVDAFVNQVTDARGKGRW